MDRTLTGPGATCHGQGYEGSGIARPVALVCCRVPLKLSQLWVSLKRLMGPALFLQMTLWTVLRSEYWRQQNETANLRYGTAL